MLRERGNGDRQVIAHHEAGHAAVARALGRPVAESQSLGSACWWTPIHIIAGQGQKQTCQLARTLIANKADLTAFDNMGRDWKMHWQHGSEMRAILEEASLRDPKGNV